MNDKAQDDYDKAMRSYKPLSADDPERAKEAQEKFNEYADRAYKRNKDKHKDKEKFEWSWENILVLVVGGGVAMLFLGVVAILTTVYVWLANGFVLTKLWAWFVMPFADKPITLWHAVGIIIILSFLTHQHQSAKEWYNEHFNSEKVPGKYQTFYILAMAAGPWLTLLVGYIAHRLMM